jgi:hypothetical protein
MMDSFEIVSITVGCVILLTILGSIAIQGMKDKVKGGDGGKRGDDASKNISAINSKWNKVKIPLQKEK